MKTSLAKEFRYLVAWLVFYVSATICSAIMGFAAGKIVKRIPSASELDTSILVLIISLASVILMAPISYALFRLVVGSLIVGRVALTSALPSIPEKHAPPAR